MKQVVRRYPLISFIVLAHLLAWSVFPLYLAGKYVFPTFPLGISLAAIIIAGLEYEKGGLLKFLRTINLRLTWWYLFALFAPLIYLLLICFIAKSLNTGGELLTNPVAEYFNFLIFYLISPFSAPIGEELGWCSFFFPRLLAKKLQFWQACFIMGLAWVSWHIPAFLVGSIDILVPHILLLLAEAFVYGWLYRQNKFNLIVAILFHSSYNAISAVSGGLGGTVTFWWLNALGVSLLAVGTIIFLKMARKNKNANIRRFKKE